MTGARPELGGKRAQTAETPINDAGEAELAVFGPTHWGGGAITATHGIAPPPLAAFLTAAHELRAPVAWLLGEVESLRDQASGPLNAAQLQATRQIAVTCARLRKSVV